MNNVESAVVGHKLNNLCARAIAGTVHANSYKTPHIHLFIGSKVAAHHPLLHYLSTVMDDYSRYIIAWKLFTSMSTDDVRQTLDLAITASGIDTPKVRRRPLLYRQRFAGLPEGPGHRAHTRQALSSDDSGQDRAVSPDHEEHHQTPELLHAGRS